MVILRIDFLWRLKLLCPNSKAGSRCIPCISKSKKLCSSFLGNVIRNLTFLWQSSSTVSCFFILLSRFGLFWLSLLGEAGVLIILLILSCKLNIGRLYMCIFSCILSISCSKNYFHPFFGQPQTALLENHP